ncbi:hypothetical protein P691DRAFT_473792 [Macrolepiota fuliginosa MF-IS2]|uniref:Uncharacterized protein n=1 Tax=Macrolepiota fuliginosa MF-IS2 TaxID=1400762 RepID=A0A9P5XG79_9AGAR|nr:hypothetical protein P691DRAFT_473792 [Macrolepiota fuliginosa MF-IS2]
MNLERDYITCVDIGQGTNKRLQAIGAGSNESKHPEASLTHALTHGEPDHVISTYTTEVREKSFTIYTTAATVPKGHQIWLGASGTHSTRCPFRFLNTFTPRRSSLVAYPGLRWPGKEWKQPFFKCTHARLPRVSPLYNAPPPDPVRNFPPSAPKPNPWRNPHRPIYCILIWSRTPEPRAY